MATGGRSDRPELLLEWLQLARCARHVAVGTWTMPPKLTGYRKPHGGPQVLMAFVQEIAPADPWAIEKAQLVAELRSRDAEIQRWTLMAERLRAEYQRSIENTTELAAVVEERVLMGHRISPEALRASGGSAAAFAQSTRAQELQQMATRLGVSVSPGTMSAAPAAPAEEVDPAYQLPPGLPPGSKVVGFRRKPSKDGPEVPTGAIEANLGFAQSVSTPKVGFV
ncbi:unnamed protein product [Cladocopium goreaui]|uniref:Uncharacterized protein n=1 Tax=Cladocopium goreaui TaxID=2562237 RepID=A0A9P1FF04_9DINO|nr:unnamed protein product [Cladocopium goreaui]